MTALVAIATAYLLLTAGKAVLAWRYVRHYPRSVVREVFSEVTILQPILGGDPSLEDALATNLAQLPGAQFVWLIDVDDAAAREVGRRLVARFPCARIQLVDTPVPGRHANPKIAKLALVEARVATEYLVVLDDDTRLTRAGLEALLAGLEDHHVSTGLPLYRRGDGLPGRLLAQFVNAQSVLTYLPLLVVAPAITLNGMCYALRTARLRALGGFAPLVNRLTDDLAVARLVREAGGRIRQTIVPLELSTTVAGWSHYFRLMHRWCVFAWIQVRSQSLAWRVAIPLVHGVSPLLLWAACVCAVRVGAAHGAWIAAGVMAVVVVTREGIHRGVRAMVGAGALNDAPASLVSELLQPLHLAHALISRRIHWRSRVIDVRADDDFTLL